MKWLNQLAQVTILVLCVGGFLAYVMETDGQSTPLVQADDWATQPLDVCVGLRDPNRMCMPTVALAMQRQHELGPPRNDVTNDSGADPDAQHATTR
jgi:hypothetical protein